jgi:hypothetical protein
MSDAGDATPTDGTNPVAARLQELGVDVNVVAKILEDFGAETLDDLLLLTEERLVEYGMKPAKALKLIATLQQSAGTEIDQSVNLPDLPGEASWLAALRTGGVLKVEDSTVMAAIRAYLANRARLFEVPDALLDSMREHARRREDPVDVSYFALRAELTRRDFGNIFEAIPGFDYEYVSEGDKFELYDRITKILLPAIGKFYIRLGGWLESWKLAMQQPDILVAAIQGRDSKQLAALTEAPDTGMIRDQAADVANAVNKVFAAEGVQIAAALAAEAGRIRTILDDERYPAFVNAKDREDMLKWLGIDVGPEAVRLEENLTRFVLAVLHLSRSPEDATAQYCVALLRLAEQIPWELVGVSSSGALYVTRIGRPAARGARLLEEDERPMR